MTWAHVTLGSNPSTPTRIMSFIRKKEDFTCEYCGTHNKGNGYTNHCSVCLYSKHVDIEPGDRLNTCRALMKPIAVVYENNDKYIRHRCIACGFEKNNKISSNDSIEAMILIQKNL